MKINYIRFILLTFFLSLIGLKQLSAQSIVSIVGDSAFGGQSLDVVITGNNTNFGQGTSTTQVWLSNGLDQIFADSVNVSSSTGLTAHITIPLSANIGDYDVNTYESVDNQLSLTNGFNVYFLDRYIASVNPNTAEQGQTLNVVITGSNTHFGQGTSTTQVWLSDGGNEIFANSVSITSPTELIANITIPLNAAPLYSVNTYESVDGQIQDPFNFFVTSPTAALTSIQADSAVQGQTLNVVITGSNTNFGQGTNTTQVWLSQGSTIIASNSVTYVSPTETIANFTFPTTGPTGYYNVRTFESIDGQLMLPNGFKLIPLDTCISGIGTASGEQGQTINMVITGYSTNFGGRAAPSVWLSQGSTQINANYVIVNNTSEVVANFTLPALAPLGLYDVNVLGSSDGLLVLTNGFILQELATGIANETQVILMDKVYPNPFTNELKIEYELKKASEVQITMYDIAGKVVNMLSASKQAGSYTHEFNTSELNIPSGIYFIRLTTNEKNYNYKVIKQ